MKQKDFSQSLAEFLKSTSNLKDFTKKITLIVYVFRKLRTAKGDVRQMSKKPRFTTPFHSQYFKRCQTLLKSLGYHFYRHLNFEHFEKKDDPHSLCISKIRNCERRG